MFGIIEDTSTSNGSAKYLNEQAVPVAGWHVGVPAWSIYPNMFTFRQGTADEPEKEYTTRNAKLLDELGVTKVALIGGGNQSSALFIERIKKSVRTSGHVATSSTRTWRCRPNSATSLAEVQAIKDSGADGIVTGMDLLQNTALSDSLSKAGVTMKATIFPGGYDPRVLGLPGIEGAIFGLEFYPFEEKKPAFQEFDKWAPQSTVRGQVPFIGWLSAEMFIQGLKEAGLELPDAQGVHHEPPAQRQLRRRRRVRSGGPVERLRPGVPVRLLRQGRERRVRAAVRRQGVLRRTDHVQIRRSAS